MKRSRSTRSILSNPTRFCEVVHCVSVEDLRNVRFFLEHIVIDFRCCSALALACCALASAAPQDAEPAKLAKPEIIVGPVSVYTFSPPESFVKVNADDVSLAQILGDLGPDAIEWYQHVQTLSNPWFEGRVPGSEGIEHAANYIQFWMEQRGLEPAFENASDRGATSLHHLLFAATASRTERTVTRTSRRARILQVASLSCSAQNHFVKMERVRGAKMDALLLRRVFARNLMRLQSAMPQASSWWNRRITQERSLIWLHCPSDNSAAHAHCLVSCLTQRSLDRC